MKLSEMLYYPLNRISQYSVSLEVILRNTPKKHPDYDRLSQASTMMTNLFKFMQERIEVSGNRAKMEDINRRVSGFEEVKFVI